MLAGQKGYGANGKQNFLFPLENMWLTQGSYTATYSHNGCYAMDFDGYLNGQFITHCPLYAPFDCKLVARWGSSSPSLVWQSTQEVNFIDGTSGFACIQITHDDDALSYTIGETRTQGQLLGHTGSLGATNDHVHIEAKKGTYEGYHQNSYGVYMLTNSTWLYDLIGCNDTNMVHTYYINHNNVRVDYPWANFAVNNPTPGPGPTPGTAKRRKFPWYVITSKRLHRI